MSNDERNVGFVVNPIAGMGGRVGLKGTDGKLDEALDKGAEPRATERAIQTLGALKQRGLELYTYGDVMGENACIEAGVEYHVVGKPDGDTRDGSQLGIRQTSAEDTRDSIQRFLEEGIDLLMFVGGDGTATDVAGVLDKRDSDVPVIGVPAGVKVYSSVFAVDPESAGEIAASYEETVNREVYDIDEDAYREGRVETELKYVIPSPKSGKMQSGKQTEHGDVEGAVETFIEGMEDGVTYVFGPGGTIGEVEDSVGTDGSPLGVDVYRDGETVVRDGGEDEILSALGERNVVVVSPLGGQGFLFGRGNQQISPSVLKRSEVEVLASREKLRDLDVLYVDTGDGDVDSDHRGWVRVLVGRNEYRMIEVV
ncbi:MAG: ATP-NAD kinase family protein [Halobacteria archaeon]